MPLAAPQRMVTGTGERPVTKANSRCVVVRRPDLGLQHQAGHHHVPAGLPRLHVAVLRLLLPRRLHRAVRATAAAVGHPRAVHGVRSEQAGSSSPCSWSIWGMPRRPSALEEPHRRERQVQKPRSLGSSARPSHRPGSVRHAPHWPPFPICSLRRQQPADAVIATGGTDNGGETRRTFP